MVVNIFLQDNPNDMKRLLLFISVMILTACTYAQKVPYNVVFDVTTGDTIVHRMVTRWVSEIINEDPTANVEVVFYAKSLDMITGKSTVTDSIVKYAAMKNVKFRVCEVAMKNNHVEKSMLLPGVETVPDGIYEIVKKQHDGWAYIKAAR
jgi:intracellular sulfur oxidation DsrE/DsrF family protein